MSGSSSGLRILTQRYVVCSSSDRISQCTIPAVNVLAIIQSHVLPICPDDAFVKEPTNTTAVIEVDCLLIVERRIDNNIARSWNRISRLGEIQSLFVVNGEPS